MKNKHLVRWLCLLLIVTVAGAAALFTAPKAEAAPAGLVLEDMPIVLPANATDVEKNAAKELQHYLREITGSASSMITESVPLDSAIYLGATEFAKANNVTYTDNTGMGEGWTIKAIGENLVITGGVTRGTLYGVYHLLEDELGVRWWNFWEEYVPTMEDAVLPLGFEKSGEPAFAYRDIFSTSRPTNLLYARNRINGWVSNPPSGFGGEIDFGQPYHVHTFNRYFPPYYVEPTSASDIWTPAINPDGVDWFVEHPEWYAWDAVKGEYRADKQMCLTNEELMEVFAEKVIIAIEQSYELADKAGRNRPLYFDVSPNDIDGSCECDRCLEVLAESGASGRLLRFVNAIAEDVEKVYPEAYIETLAYGDYLEVPLDDTVPRHNVVMRLANSDADALHNWSHPNNQHVEDRITAWSQILEPHQMLLWDYHLNYHENGVFPSYFRISNDYQMFHKAGGTGVFTELEGISESEFWDMKHWMLMKLMEDPYLDEYDLAMDFLNGYYGEAAAEHIYTYQKFWEAEAADYYEITLFDNDILRADWITLDAVLQSNGYFEDAIAALEADDSLTEEERELFINRVQAARGGLDRLILFNYYDYVDELAAKGQTFPLNRQEVGKRMVTAMQWLLDMELEEDYTGKQSVAIRSSYGGSTSSYKEYLGEVDEVTGEMIERPEIPQQIFDDHPGIDRAHIYDYNYPNFWNATVQGSRTLSVVKNGASYPGGSALMWDQKNIAEVEGKLANYYVVTDTVAFGGPGKLYLDDIIADGEWHLYRVEDEVILREGKTWISFMADTARIETDHLTHLTDKKVDVYFNMKVEGDPTGTNPNNYGKFYIDRVFVVEPCTAYNVQYTSQTPATCASNATQTGICPVCGQEASAEIPGTQLPHNIVGGYTWDDDKKVYRAECKDCGKVEFDFLGQLPEELLQQLVADGTDLNKVHDFGLDNQFILPNNRGEDQTTVADSDSLIGTAVRWDVMKSPSYGYFAITGSRAMKIQFGTNPVEKFYSDDIITDGKYHLYKVEDVVVHRGGSDTRMHFFNETLRVDFVDLPQLEDRRVDVYISFKVEGDLVFEQNAENSPIYYIDRVIAVEKCNGHVSETYTYNAATNTYEGTCVDCGKPVTHSFTAELPQEILDAVAEVNTDLAHVYDYDYYDTVMENGYYGETRIVDDPEASLGKATVLDLTTPKPFNRGNCLIYDGGGMHVAFVNYGRVATIPYEELKANEGNGKYHLYKLDDVEIPQANVTWLALFDNCYIRNYEVSEHLRSKIGQKVDIYISMKIEGDLDGSPSWPKYYIDRWIVVDDCSDYLDADSIKLISNATCYQGTTHSAFCTACGKTSIQEDVESRLAHDFGPYVLQPDGKTKVASCRNDGCTVTKSLNVEVELPQQVLDDLAAEDIGLEHVYDYDYFDKAFEDGTYGNDCVIVEDADAAFGYATLLDLTTPKSFNRIRAAVNEGGLPVHVVNYGQIATIPYEELKANAGSGEYHLYKLEDVTFNYKNAAWLALFESCFIRNQEMNGSFLDKQGHEVDIYISMKIEGTDLGLGGSSAGYPKYYIDRWIIVDPCDNYEIKYVDDGTADCTQGSTLIGACPVCDKRSTKPGTGASHKFTTYYQDLRDKMKYVAECDFGCGTTDVKYDPRLEPEDLLPDELPENVRNHVLFVYSSRELTYSYESGYRWDMDLGYPVVVREYDDLQSETGKAAMVMSATGGIPICWYPKGTYPAHGIGTFSGAEMIANANDGQYHIYAAKGIRAITLPAYNYMYMFSDWDMQIRMIDEDLEAYRDQVLDFYLYMKVEGDPTCGGADKPKYYLAQFIVAQSCKTDETWTVTKEPTCTETGEMVGDCSVCGLKGSVVSIPKTAHNVVEGVPYSDPTCRDNAVVRGICTTCGKREFMEVEGTNLDCVFENYILQDDGVTEIAYCSLGCGERHIRSATPSMNNPQTPDLPVLDALQPFMPVLGGAAGGSSFGFSDIKESDWYFESVKEAWSNKLINGVTATEFRPNETLTVAQAVKLASAYHEMNYTGDVTLENGSGNWYSSYVDYAVENGIIDRGYASKSTSEMNKAIDRSEFVSIFAKAMDEGSLVGYNDVADNAIPDVKIDDENADAIYKFYRAGILTGSDGKGTFNPTSSIKRSEVAAILSRMFDSNVRQAITLK